MLGRLVIGFWLVLILSPAHEALASTRGVDPEATAILELQAKSTEPGQGEAVVRQLKDLIADDSRHKGHRLLAIGVLGQIAVAQGIWGMEDYFLNIVSDFDRSLGFGEQAFLQASRVQVYKKASPEERMKCLDDLLDARLGDFFAILTANWAAEELCNRGYSGPLAKIEAAFRRRSPQDAEKNMTVCRSQITYLQQHDTRFDALSAALQGSPEDAEIRTLVHQWAIRELGKIEGPKSEELLRQHALAWQEQFRVAYAQSEAIAATKVLLERNWSAERLEAEGVALEIILEAGGVPEWAKPKSDPTKNQVMPDESTP